MRVRVYVHVSSLFQKLLNEYENLHLLRASLEASKCGDDEMRTQILSSARMRVEASSVDFARVAVAASALRKKPIRIDLEVCCLSD